MAEKLDSILKSYVADGTATKDKLLGASFIVVGKDGPIYQGSAGRTRVDPSSPPFQTDSITWMASMTKLVTTACVMHLVSRGLVTLDEDLRPRVPELAALPILKGFADSDNTADSDDKDSEKKSRDGAPLLEPNTSPVTLRHLLTHTAGLGINPGDPDLQRWAAWAGVADHVGSCTLAGWSTPLKFAPGAGWYYSTGTDWAGQVLERVAGVRLGEYLGGVLGGGLGMEDTGFFRERVVGEGKKGRFVPIAERDAEGGGLTERAEMFPAEPQCESGGAGLYSSAADFGKVVQALLKGGLDGEGIMKREVVDEMFKPQLDETQRQWMRAILWAFGSGAELPEGMPVDYGIGGVINMEDVEGRRRKGSLMWSGMCNSRWWIDRETGIGAAMVVNVYPYNDPTALKMYDELERAVYAELVPKWQAST
ncbi:beta-lactamase/transpeptidase-like protein [Chaetomium fimeti]|uniref:Beta-lactamase/transpeptidase-like protein n=1 Tax=Chaetomium fimeti TaxID=1854472 RepID=A0AAE0LQ57_9PEZI|nr:beta-lactamase/transpeptidase-like protein [Chaetomium fimeti]